MKFDIFICMIAGIAATAVMTLFLNIFAMHQIKKFTVILILGTMLTGETTTYKGLSRSHKSLYTGIIAHYLTGCLLSCLFYLMCSGYGGFTILNTIFFSAGAGTIAVIAWQILFYVHSRPPLIQISEYLRLIFAAQVLFTIVLLIVYNLFY